MSEHCLDEELQSAYRAMHSTETALLKVVSDIRRSLDSNKGVVLLMLDLSAAFDTVDYDILLRRLTRRLKSYLCSRTQCVPFWMPCQLLLNYSLEYHRDLCWGPCCL